MRQCEWCGDVDESEGTCIFFYDSGDPTISDPHEDEIDRAKVCEKCAADIMNDDQYNALIVTAEQFEE